MRDVSRGSGILVRRSFSSSFLVSFCFLFCSYKYFYLTFLFPFSSWMLLPSRLLHCAILLFPFFNFLLSLSPHFSPSLFFDFPPSLLYPFIFFSIQSRKAPTRTYTPGRKGFSQPYPNDVNPTRKCLLVVTSSRKVTGAPLSFRHG